MELQFTVIIPVYNAGDYLAFCLDSLVKQVKDDTEVLIIDDGSTDGSGVVADGYANAQIKVFHIPNGGVSHARNFGLDHAAGAYISFLDADDFVVDGYFDTLRECVKKKSDWYLFAHYTYKNGATEYLSSGVTASMHRIRKKLFTLELSAPWDKLFVREKIGDLRFDESLKRYEDLAFVMDYSQKIKTVTVSEQAIYCYRLNEQSTCALPVLAHFDSCNAIYEKLRAAGEQESEASLQPLLFAVTLIAVRIFKRGGSRKQISAKLKSLPLYRDLTERHYDAFPFEVRKLCLKFGLYRIATALFWY